MERKIEWTQIEAAQEDAYEEALLREAVRARDLGVTTEQIQSILDGESTTQRRLAILRAFADDKEKANVQAARLAAAVMDGSIEDDEDEEILRDVIVAQVMEWTAKGSDPTDLAGIEQAAAALHTWEIEHRPAE